MVTFEQVERLCKRTNISYEEAKQVLEETNGDLLEAVISLERQNRIKPPCADGYYNSKDDTVSKESTEWRREEKKKRKTTGEIVANFFRLCGRIIHKGNINNFEVQKDERPILAIPLTAMALLLLFAFWVVVPVLIIGLIFGYRYKFIGPDLEQTKVNEAMKTVSNATMRAVNSVMEGTENFSQDKGEKQNGENSNH